MIGWRYILIGTPDARDPSTFEDFAEVPFLHIATVRTLPSADGADVSGA